MKRSSLLASGTVVGVIIGSVLVATPAVAATADITSGPQLLDFAASCVGSNTAVITADITVSEVISVQCDLTIDLHGAEVRSPGVDVGVSHILRIDDTFGGGSLLADATVALFRPGIRVRQGATLIIEDGTIRAYGGQGGAGIGGGQDVSVGDVTINGGDVIASGGVYTAGIGGGQLRSGGTVTITGGTVVANGTTYAAGIGGGEYGAGGTVSVSGGSVLATGFSGGAGIGGGRQAAGGTVTISGGTVVADSFGTGAGIGSGGSHPGGDAPSGPSGGSLTVTGGELFASCTQFCAAIGGGKDASGAVVSITAGTVHAEGVETAVGAGFDGAAFGSLALGGTLDVDGTLNIVDGAAQFEVVIGSTGLLRGHGADPTAGAVITGSGGIDNQGVIALTSDLVGVSVSSHNYLVGFDLQDGSSPTSVRLFAPTFATGYRTFPTGTWNTAVNGSGSAFLATTPVTASLTVYAAPPDGDGDGVPNAADVCPSSDLSGASPTKPKNVKPNNFWFTGTGLTDGKTTYTLAATGGCTANDIVRAMSLGSGQLKAGLSPGSMKTWLATHG